MTEHYFLYAFGVNGNLASIPNPTQVSGTVSYQAGFPIGYELANTAPGYLPVPRDQFNQLMFDTTGALQQLQQTGFPSWITSAANGGTPFSYALGAQVWQGGIPYRSLIAGNTDTPPTANWAVIGTNRSRYFNYALDTGSANHYLIAPNPAIDAYADGDVIQLRPAFACTGACDINVNSLGVKSIKTLANVDPAAGMINPAGQYQLVYNGNTSCFVIQNPTLGSAAYVNTGTSAGQVPLNSNLGTAAYLNVGATANLILQLNGIAQIPAVSGALLTNLPAQYSVTNSASGKIVLGAVTIQWGTGTATTTYRATFIPFNVNFSGAPYYVNFVPLKTSSPPNFTTGTQNTPNISGAGVGNILDGTGFYAQMQDNGTAPCYWMAIGPT